MPVTAITAYERGNRPPTQQDLAALADVLQISLGALLGPPGADESFEYWELICAAMPPMTSDELASVVTILRRIDHRRHEQQRTGQPPGRDTPV